MTGGPYGAATLPASAPEPGHEPVLVAMKPYQGFDSALAMAKWIATAQDRPLHAVRVLEPHDTLALAGAIPVMADCHAEERSAIADVLEERLGHDTAGLTLEQRV